MIIRFKKGFTMAELMIVIGVIGILAASLYPSYAAYIARSKASAVQLGVVELKRAIDNYYVSVGAYKQVLGDFQGSCDGTLPAFSNTVFADSEVSMILKKLRTKLTAGPIPSPFYSFQGFTTYSYCGVGDSTGMSGSFMPSQSFVVILWNIGNGNGICFDATGFSKEKNYSIIPGGQIFTTWPSICYSSAL